MLLPVLLAVMGIGVEGHEYTAVPLAYADFVKDAAHHSRINQVIAVVLDERAFHELPEGQVGKEPF